MLVVLSSFPNLLRNPPSRGSIVIVYGSSPIIEVVAGRAGLVEVVVDHEVVVAISSYPDSVALLVRPGPAPDRVPLNVVVVGIISHINAAVGIADKLGVANYRVADNGVVVIRYVEGDAIDAVTLNMVPTYNIVA